MLVWLGRMSSEKRVLEFIEAIAASGIDADVRLYGAGLLLEQVNSRIAAHGLGDRVSVVGPVSHEAALEALRDADALVQTSVGFETQGLTPFEAALLGTPTIFCDVAIAEDVAVTPAWLVDAAADADGAESVEALAATLSDAVQQLRASPGELRVEAAQTRAFLQSEQTRLLVAHYERLLGASG